MEIKVWLGANHVDSPPSSPVALTFDSQGFMYKNQKIDKVEAILEKNETLASLFEVTTAGKNGETFDLKNATLVKDANGLANYRSGATWDGDGDNTRIFVTDPEGAGQNASWLFAESAAPPLKLRVVIRRKAV